MCVAKFGGGDWPQTVYTPPLMLGDTVLIIDASDGLLFIYKCSSYGRIAELTKTALCL